MNLAHSLTLLRIFLSPLFPLFYLGQEWLGIPYIALPYILFTLLVVSELSDLFDGILARKYNQVTDLGKVLDPMADSITHISLFLSFTQGIVQLPMLVVLVFFYRDFIISTLRTLCALRGVALAARPSGKIKTIMQGIVAASIILLMIPQSLGYLPLVDFQRISCALLVMAAIYTVYSAVDYFFANRRALA